MGSNHAMFGLKHMFIEPNQTIWFWYFTKIFLKEKPKPTNSKISRSRSKLLNQALLICPVCQAIVVCLSLTLKGRQVTKKYTKINFCPSCSPLLLLLVQRDGQNLIFQNAF